MTPVRLPNGNLRVPVGGKTEGGVCVDGWQEISPDHPDWAGWQRWLENNDPLPTADTARTAA